MPKNNNCSGGHCRVDHGEVRVYPLSGGGNLILCRACWDHENNYRRLRGIHYGRPEEWPQHNWFEAEIYDNG